MQEITFALNSLKTALDVGSFLLKADSALDKALLKVELEKMIDALIDTKHTVRDLDDRLYEQSKVIKELEEKLRNTKTTVGFLNARYHVNEKGEPTGAPFCPTCWGAKKELIPLTSGKNGEPIHKCGQCGSSVNDRMSPLNVDYYIKTNRDAAEKQKSEFIVKIYD